MKNVVLICTASNGKLTFHRKLKKRIGEDESKKSYFKTIFKQQPPC